MVFEIAGIVIVDNKGGEIPAVDIKGDPIADEDVPEGFYPKSYGIKLGMRIS